MKDNTIILDDIEDSSVQGKKKKKKGEILCWIIPYVIVFIIAVAFLLCFRFVVVCGDSMNNTYKDGNIVIVNHLDYMMMLSQDTTLERGTVIVTEKTDTCPEVLIKRIIAKGGDTIDFDFEKGNVILNGSILNEPYIKELTFTDEQGFTYPLFVEDDTYFIMGDNRNCSTDSRSASVGLVHKNDIYGYVMCKLW